MSRPTRQQISYNSKYGTVHAKVTMLPGCCGVAVVYDVGFFPHNRDCEYKFARNKLYKEFDTYLRTSNSPYHLDRSKIIMSDYVGGEIDTFVKYVKTWKISAANSNGKSGNKIRTYECTRRVVSNF